MNATRLRHAICTYSEDHSAPHNLSNVGARSSNNGLASRCVQQRTLQQCGGAQQLTRRGESSARLKAVAAGSSFAAHACSAAAGHSSSKALDNSSKAASTARTFVQHARGVTGCSRLYLHLTGKHRRCCFAPLHAGSCTLLAAGVCTERQGGCATDVPRVWITHSVTFLH